MSSHKPAVAPTSEQNWIALIHCVAGGDQTALAQLYDQTSRLVYGLALRILGDAGAAEEATLDVYLQVWRQAYLFDAARGNPVAWLMTLARSRAIDRLRSSARARRQEEPLEAAAQTADAACDPEQDAFVAERQRLIQAALDQLGPEQREVITVAYFSDLSHTEIAAHLGLPLGTVKTRIRLGMARLRDYLREFEEGGI